MMTAAMQAISCRCGRVKLEVNGDPIVTTICHCRSCRQAGEALARLPGAEPVLSPEGGTPFVLYRKDHLRCLQGASLLAEHRLRSTSPTRRVVAICCNTAMFLDFTKGHWISVYRNRAPIGSASEASKSGYFVPRLLWAWMRMGFRTPKVDWVTRCLQEPA